MWDIQTCLSKKTGVAVREEKVKGEQNCNERSEIIPELMPVTKSAGNPPRDWRFMCNI